MKLQKVEKLDKKVISSIKIYTRPFTSVNRFDSIRFKHVFDHFVKLALKGLKYHMNKI